MGILNAENARARLESGFWDDPLQLEHYEVIDFFSIIGDAGPNCKCDFCKQKFSMADIDGLEEHLRANHTGAVRDAEAKFK